MVICTLCHRNKTDAREGGFVVWVMIATIGYATQHVGNMISDWMKNMILPVRKNS
jgi:hypothetical protein